MFLILMLSLTMEFVGSGTGPPDIKNFTPVLSKELEFRINDYKTAFVGRVVDYQNPADPNEFVRVYYRQVALVSARAKENKTAGASGSIGTLSNLNYHRNQETKALGKAQQVTDAFAYVQWRIVRDPRTGQDIMTGFLRSWLLGQNGDWTFGSGYNLLTSPFSEPSKADPKKRIIVGIQFTLVGGVHIVRIDQDDVQDQDKGAVNDKK